MGSRRTHDDRMARLRDEGVPEELLARLSSPIGLDIGARTPEEIALSILAEIVSTRRARTVPPAEHEHEHHHEGHCCHE
jgi:xanthine dehydrogenase accessory factor